MKVRHFSALYWCYCFCTTLLLIFTITATVQGGLLIKDKGKKGQIIVFGKPCMPTLIKTGGKKGKQLIVLPAENGNGQNCGKQEGGGLQGGGYGNSGSSFYGNSYYENAGYGGRGYSYQNNLLYSSPMMMTGMPLSSDRLYSHQMMANMEKMQKMMSSAYEQDEMMMMPVYSSSGLGMSGENKHDSLKMNTYGSSGNNKNSRPMHTDSSYKTGRPLMKSENEINRGQHGINHGGHSDDSYDGKTKNAYSMVSGSKYVRELQNDDHDDDQLQLQHKRQQMHVNSVENMLSKKSKMRESSRSWRKKADDEMMHAMASMLVRSRFQAPDAKHRPHY